MKYLYVENTILKPQISKRYLEDLTVLYKRARFIMESTLYLLFNNLLK